MGKGRLEAFSDGVIAIIITIMVLEMKVPHGADFHALHELLPVFFGYVLSFIYVGIYWNNHHHLMHAVKKVSGGVLWANLHLLFWLSLMPFTTGWLSENRGEPIPTALYGFGLLMCGVAYGILVRVLLRTHGPDSTLAKAIGNDFKGNISVAAYVLAIALACKVPVAADVLYVAVALMWLVPDRRIESRIQE